MRFYDDMDFLNTKVVGKVLLEFDELPSTNDYIRHFSNEVNASEGLVVRARHQIAGRGQMGTTWESPAGSNLLFSFLLRPVWLPPDKQFYLSAVIATAVATTLKKLLPALPVSIKWPNDILVNQKKVAGILIENAIQGQQFTTAIVGIGLNINQTEFPGQLNHATSLAIQSGEKWDTEFVFNQLLWQLDQAYQELSMLRFDRITTEYFHWLEGKDVWRTYKLTDSKLEFEGRITGIDAYGLLCMETHEGLKKFALKEIEQWGAFR